MAARDGGLLLSVASVSVWVSGRLGICFRQNLRSLFGQVHTVERKKACGSYAGVSLPPRVGAESRGHGRESQSVF